MLVRASIVALCCAPSKSGPTRWGLSPSRSVDEKAELMEVIGQYRQGLVPLIVPIVLLRHHARRVQEPCLSRQLYPAELMLRNHV